MHTLRTVVLAATCLFSGTFAGVASAQQASQPLNLQLPPSAMPAVAATITASPPPVPVARNANGNPTSAPGVYYGDTSGRTGNAEQPVAAQRCNDSTYNQPQTHGSVSMGVVGGNHVSGSYQAGTFAITKQLGDCEHPSGSIGVTISVGQSRVHGRGW